MIRRKKPNKRKLISVKAMWFFYGSKQELLYRRSYHCSLKFMNQTSHNLFGLQLGDVYLYNCVYKQTLRVVIRFLRDLPEFKYFYLPKDRVLLVYLGEDVIAKDTARRIVEGKLWLNN